MTDDTGGQDNTADALSARPRHRRKTGPVRFGLKLRELRKQAEITLESLAQQTGINIATLSQIEHGKKRPPELIPHVSKIAELCGLEEGSPEWQAFVELAKKERFPRVRKPASMLPPRRRQPKPPIADESSALPQGPEILRALAAALDKAGNRRVLRVMLRLEDNAKVVVSLTKKQEPTKDAG